MAVIAIDIHLVSLYQLLLHEVSVKLNRFILSTVSLWFVKELRAGIGESISILTLNVCSYIKQN